MKVAKTKIVNLTSTELKKLQETDKSLDKLRMKIESNSVERSGQWGTEVFYIDQKNGLMYRQFTSPPEKGSVVRKQLVLPHSLRESVLEVAHDSIIGGHLATNGVFTRAICSPFVGSQLDCRRSQTQVDKVFRQPPLSDRADFKVT